MRPFLYGLIILCSAAFLSVLAPTDLRAYSDDCDFVDDTYDCGIGKFVTPNMVKELFRRLQNSPAWVHKNNKSIWEPDHSKHGGEQWKRWNSQKDWEQGQKPVSVWPDGRVRKEGE